MIINLAEHRANLEAEKNALFAEIDSHTNYGEISVSIWDSSVIREMLLHSARNRSTEVLHSYVNDLLSGKELSFKNGNITSIFRIATPKDIKRANEYEKNFQQELNEFLASEDYDDSLTKYLLEKLGLE